MRKFERYLLGAFAALGISTAALAADDSLTAQMFKATPNGPGDAVGTVTATQGPQGTIVLNVAVHGLPPGPHGFHIHQNDSCLPTLTNGVRIPAGGAGGHWDPANTGKHLGPEGEGHKGDLPVLEVSNAGKADVTLPAPHIRNLSELRGLSVMIHAGGDNYSDDPAPLGGGGLRIACGVFPK